jgi:hypothetical protein
LAGLPAFESRHAWGRAGRQQISGRQGRGQAERHLGFALPDPKRIRGGLKRQDGGDVLRGRELILEDDDGRHLGAALAPAQAVQGEGAEGDGQQRDGQANEQPARHRPARGTRRGRRLWTGGLIVGGDAVKGPVEVGAGHGQCIVDSIWIRWFTLR